ncbi:ATP-binding protein [Chitinophaga lutea]
MLNGNHPDLRPRIYILPLLFLCLYANAQGSKDTSRYLLRHYDNSSGLPQNSVNAIGADPEGYIWLATENGLVRYDGLHFRLRTGDKPLLRNNRYYNIGYDSQGRLSAMNYDNEAVVIEHGRVTRDSLTPLSSRDFVRWQQPGNAADSGTSYHVRLPLRPMTWGANLESLVWQAGDHRQVQYRNGVMTSIRNGKAEYRHAFDHHGGWNFFLLGDVLFFLEKDGRSVRFGPKLQVAGLKGDITRDPAFARRPGETKVFWNRIQPEHVLLYVNQSFYLTTASGNGLTTRRIFSGFDISASNIIAAYYDTASGSLYLGSGTLGLFILSPQSFSSNHVPDGNNSHYSIVPYSRDRIISRGFLFGLPGSPVERINWTMLGTDFYSASPDGTGYIWMKGHNELYRYQLAPPFRTVGIWKLPAKITMLYTDSLHRLWIGLNSRQGVWTIDSRNPGATAAKLLDFTQDPTCFAEDGNTMYIGADGGFYALDRTTGRIDTIHGLSRMYVRSARVTRPGEVWVTTYEHGFFLYRQGRLTAFPADNDRYLLNAHCIYADHNGYIWIPTNKGLFQARQADLLAYAADSTMLPYYHYYDRNDGFATNEFNGGCQPCAAEMGNGYVALPSLNGVVFFHPDSVRPLMPEAAVSLDKILLNKAPLAVDSVIKLQEQFNSLQLEFSSPYMGNRKNLQLNYALMRVGEADTIWIPLPEDGRVTLSALPPGDYTLVVRKPDGFGAGNYSDKTLRLHVETPWYETRLFYFALLLLGIGITWLVTRLRTVYVKRKNAMLEALVASKTRELQARSALQEKIIQSVSHNILTPLKYQQLLSKKIFETVEPEAATLTDMSRILNDHTHYLYHMVANLLRYLKSQIAEREVTEQLFFPAATAEAVLKIFTGIAREKGTRLINDIAPPLTLSGDEVLLSVILHNLTDNAVKVTTNGRITIASKTAGGGTALVISDTGPGMRPDLIQWFNHGGSRDYPLAGGGIGLLIVKELAQAMGLHVAVTAVEGKGTEFTIWFPGERETR